MHDPKTNPGQGAEGSSAYVGKHRQPHEKLNKVQFAGHTDDSIDSGYYTKADGSNDWEDR